MLKSLIKDLGKDTLCKAIENEIKKKLDIEGDITLTDIGEFVAAELNGFGDIFEKIVDSKTIQQIKEHTKKKTEKEEQLRKDRDRDHKIYMALKEKHMRENNK